MALAIEAVSPADREWLISELTPDPTPDQVRELAQRLLARMLSDENLVREAELEVKRVANLLRDVEATQEAAKHSGYYQFGWPSRATTSEHQVYNQYRVHERDFPAFCRHFGLSESQMLKVARGEVWSHNDWIQGLRPGNLGKRYRGDPRAFGISISRLWKGYQAVPNSNVGLVFLPAVWWSPAE